MCNKLKLSDRKSLCQFFIERGFYSFFAIRKLIVELWDVFFNVNFKRFVQVFTVSIVDSERIRNIALYQFKIGESSAITVLVDVTFVEIIAFYAVRNNGRSWFVSVCFFPLCYLSLCIICNVSLAVIVDIGYNICSCLYFSEVLFIGLTALKTVSIACVNACVFGVKIRMLDIIFHYFGMAFIGGIAVLFSNIHLIADNIVQVTDNTITVNIHSLVECVPVFQRLRYIIAYPVLIKEKVGESVIGDIKFSVWIKIGHDRRVIGGTFAEIGILFFTYVIFPRSADIIESHVAWAKADGTLIRIKQVGEMWD